MYGTETFNGQTFTTAADTLAAYRGIYHLGIDYTFRGTEAALFAAAEAAGWQWTFTYQGIEFRRPVGRRYLTVMLNVRGAFQRAADARRNYATKADALAVLAAG